MNGTEYKRKYTATFNRSTYYKDLINNHNHPIKPSKHIGRYKTLSKCLSCFKIGNKWDYATRLRLYCNKDCENNYKIKYAVDNNIRIKSKRRNKKETENDFTTAMRRKIFQNDLLKPNEDLILKAIEKFEVDIRNCDYICPECIRPIERKKNLIGDIRYNKSFGYNVELTHIDHNPNINNIEFDSNFNIVSKSVKYKCSNCHSLEFKQTNINKE